MGIVFWCFNVSYMPLKIAIPMDSTVNLISAVVLIGVGISVIFKDIKKMKGDNYG